MPEMIATKVLNFASHLEENTLAQAKETASMPFVTRTSR